MPAVGAVEIAGRLVGQDDRRIVGQRAGDGDALLLAARELRRIVMAAVRAGRPRRAAPRPARRRRARPAISIGTSTFSNAVSDGTRWKNWKTKPMFWPRSRASASSPSVVMSMPSITIVAGRRRVEPGHQAEQRRLAAARRADDGEALRRRSREIERMQDGQRLAAARRRSCDTPRSSIMKRRHDRDAARAAAAARATPCRRRAARRARSDGCRRPGSAPSMPATPSSRNGTSGTLLFARDAAERLRGTRWCSPGRSSAALPCRTSITRDVPSRARADDRGRGSSSARRPAGRAGRRWRRARRPASRTSPSSAQSSRRRPPAEVSPDTPAFTTSKSSPAASMRSWSRAGNDWSRRSPSPRRGCRRARPRAGGPRSAPARGHRWQGGPCVGGGVPGAGAALPDGIRWGPAAAGRQRHARRPRQPCRALSPPVTLARFRFPGPTLPWRIGRRPSSLSFPRLSRPISSTTPGLSAPAARLQPASRHVDARDFLIAVSSVGHVRVDLARPTGWATRVSTTQ